MPFKDLVAIIGNARSGTTAFGHAIAAATGATYLGEIFHAVRGPQDDAEYEKYLIQPWTNFFSFKESVVREFPALVYPSEENQRILWRLFLHRVRERAQTRKLIIDIKYNSLHHLNFVWQDPAGTPGQLKILRGDNVPIFHLVRNDLFAQAVSIQRAQLTGQWHFVASGPPPEIDKIKIDPEAAARFMQISAAGRQFVAASLRSYKPALEVVYENLFDDEGRLTQATRRRVGDVLGTELKQETELKLRKILSQPLDALISNKDEILTHFKGHRFENEVRMHFAKPAARRTK
jgi:LPS sulfotransferase NodH